MSAAGLFVPTTLDAGHVLCGHGILLDLDTSVTAAGSGGNLECWLLRESWSGAGSVGGVLSCRNIEAATARL